MISIRICSGLLILLLFLAGASPVSLAQSKQPTQKEVAEYVKLLDAKITFNRAQGNTAKVKQLKSEKQRTLSRWKALQKKDPSAKKTVQKKAVAVKPPVKKAAAVKAAKKIPAKLPSTQKEVRAYIQTVDAQIASFKAQGNVAKVKALRAQKQKALKNWQAIQNRQAKQNNSSVKSSKTVSIKNTDLEGPIGAWLNNGHTAFRVVKTELKDADPRGQRPPEGTRFFVVTVELKNKDPFTAVYGGDYHRVMVIDAKRVYYMENISKNPVNWADNEDIKELMTGESVGIAYVFNIPTEAVPDKLIFDASAADKYPVMRVSLR